MRSGVGLVYYNIVSVKSPEPTEIDTGSRLRDLCMAGRTRTRFLEEHVSHFSFLRIHGSKGRPSAKY